MSAAPHSAPIQQRILDAHVLIVDDVEFNRVIIEEILRSCGFKHFDSAENGKVALERIALRAPDAIILDLMMPEMDGFEFIKQLRADARYAKIPILVQTAMSSVDERLEIFRLGADDIILKPINSTELISRLYLHLRHLYAMADLEAYQSRLAQELAAAKSMQLSLLPEKSLLEDISVTHGVCVSGLSRTCTELGGDLWNVKTLSPSRIAFYSFDIAGHGVAAAINAFRVHSLFDTATLKYRSAGEMLTHINNVLHGVFQPGQFSTFFCGVVDSEAGTLDYAAAACPAPILYRADKKQYELLQNEGLPLGILPDTHYGNIQLRFQPGDSLLLFSDALTESPHISTGAMLNETEIAELVKSTALGIRSHARDAHEQIFVTLLHSIGLTEDSAPLDDLTIVLVTRER